MTKFVYERVPKGEADFRQDVEWAREHPEYWSEKLKLDVATHVAAQLDRLGISQAELARRMGTSPAFVTKILRGYHNWTLETLAKAGVVLGVQWLVTSEPIDRALLGDGPADNEGTESAKALYDRSGSHKKPRGR